ncbi:hypothetical protein GC167_02450 [bacterium]|nr:hypothetical protein [bacterium]
MIQTIPLFPLSVLLLPGEECALHIFEERYRQLIALSIEDSLPFGIPCNHSMNTLNVGSMVEVKEVNKRYPGGESDIVVRCTGLFRLNRFFYRLETVLYPGGEVEMLDWKQSMQREYEQSAHFATDAHQAPVAVAHVLSKAVGLGYDLADKLHFVRQVRQGEGLRYLERRNEYYELIRLQENKTASGFYLN